MRNSEEVHENDPDRMVDEEEEEEEEETVEITKVNGEDSLVMNASVLNGDDDEFDEDEEHQLSIDTGEQEEQEPEQEVVRPTIRVAKGLVKEPTTNTLTNGSNKRKSLSTSVTLPVKKARASVVDTEQEARRLEEEVRALAWLARRKEQEWEQCVRLLKQKEERLLLCRRNRILCLTETENIISKLQPVVVPQQQVGLLLLPPAPTSCSYILLLPPSTS